MNLPIELVHGSIGKMSINIPWSKLTSTSVCIHLEDLYILVRPTDTSEWRSKPDVFERIKKELLESKRKALDKIANALLGLDAQGNPLIKPMRDSEKDEKELGYFNRLALQIADNIKIDLKNIHIRFEDTSQMIFTSPFSRKKFSSSASSSSSLQKDGGDGDGKNYISAGLTIASFQIRPVDNNWNDSYISADSNQNKRKDHNNEKAEDSLKRNKMDLNGFSFYWNIDTPFENRLIHRYYSKEDGSISNTNLQKMLYYMLSAIPDPNSSTDREAPSSSSSNNIPSPLLYILRPSSIEVKCIRNEIGAVTSLAKLNLQINVKQVDIDIQAEQYQQILRCKANFDAINSYKELVPFRPSLPVTRDNARAWWKYAIQCVKRNSSKISMADSFHTFILRRHYFKLYEKKLQKDLYNRKLDKIEKNPDISKKVKANKTQEIRSKIANYTLSNDEVKKLEEIETQISSTTLSTWRALVISTKQKKLLRKKNRLEKQRPKNSPPSMSSFFSSNKSVHTETSEKQSPNKTFSWGWWKRTETKEKVVNNETDAEEDNFKDKEVDSRSVSMESFHSLTNQETSYVDSPQFYDMNHMENRNSNLTATDDSKQVKVDTEENEDIYGFDDDDDDDDSLDSEEEEEYLGQDFGINSTQYKALVHGGSGLEEGDVTIGELLKSNSNLGIDEPSSLEVMKNSNIAEWDVEIVSAGSLYLFSFGRVPLMESNARFTLEACQVKDDISATFMVNEVNVHDKFTQNALFNSILGLKKVSSSLSKDSHSQGVTPRTSFSDRIRDKAGNNLLCINVFLAPKLTSLEMLTNPVDIIYNQQFVSEILSLFEPPKEITEALTAAAVENLSTAATIAQESFQDNITKLEVKIEIDGPRIIIPVLDQKDCGLLCLDTGKLIVCGGTNTENKTQSEWHVSLTDVQSKLPLSVKSWRNNQYDPKDT